MRKRYFLVLLFIFIAFTNLLLSYDGETFRSFSPVSLATAENAVKKQITKSEWEFTFTNNTNYNVNGLYFESAQSIISVDDLGPFNSISNPSPDRKKWQFNGNVSIAPGQSVVIKGTGAKKAVKLSKWYWTVNGNRVGFVNRSSPTSEQKFFLPMPNISNLGEELFKKTDLSKGLVVGIPQNAKNTSLAWVRIKKWKDLQKNLIDNSGMHISNPQGFKNFTDGKPIKGEQKILSPKKFNDRLFAELITLKFNIAASKYGRTPVGFENLIFSDPTNPLNGLTVDQIALKADSAMTFYNRFSTSMFIILEQTINKINRAFEGAIDTVSFGTKTVFTGAKSIDEVNFLVVGKKSSSAIFMGREGNNTEEKEFEIPIQNYPNPFNPKTIIEFKLNKEALVSLKVYDMLGREIAVLAEDALYEAGVNEVEFDGQNLAAGIYFYQIIVRDTETQELLYRTAKKMILNK
ncbi:MAG: T9SS type A sorting domain-containing protein [Ignavibacteria bacterium]|nr:T9SS type A sorting domain-containing protein [Ignavibacteria bacterium]